MARRSYVMIDYKLASMGAASHSYYVGDTFADLPVTGMAIGDLAYDKATGIFYTANSATTLSPVNPGAQVFTKGLTLADSGGVTAVTVTPWVAPFACTVTAMQGYRVGGTGATVQAYRATTASPIRSSALSLTSANTWMPGTPLQNTAISSGQSLLLGVLTVAGTPTEVSIQLTLFRDLDMAVPELGVNETHRTAFEARAGFCLWDRYYISGSSQPSFPIAAITNAANTGHRMCISFKCSGTWAQTAAGNSDTWLTNLANYCASLPTEGILVFHHEPENDTSSSGRLPSDWRNAMTHIINLTEGILRPAGWEYWNCLMDWTFDTGSSYPNIGGSRVIDDWWVNGLDGVGIDSYNWLGLPSNGDPTHMNTTANPPRDIFGAAGATAMSTQGIFRPDNAGNRRGDVRTYAASKGKPYGLMEFGSAVKWADTAGTARTAWLNSQADYILANPDPNFLFVMYFEMNDADGFVEWRIANTSNTPNSRGEVYGNEANSTTAFARFDDGVVVPPVSNQRVLVID